MNHNEKGRVEGAACSEKNKSLPEVSMGLVPPQTQVIATGEFRRELLTMISILQETPGFEDGVRIVSTADGPDTVFIFGVETPDRTAALGLEVTVDDWRPMSSIPALCLFDGLLEVGCIAESAKSLARRSTRGGRTILTSRDPSRLVRDLKDIHEMLGKLADRIQNQNNWQPIPENKVVSVSWWPMLPTGGNQ